MTARRPSLHLITDARLERTTLLAAVAGAVAAGVDWVHARWPTASARDLAGLTADLLAICRPLGVRVAVNDRLDVALALGADGVQVGERGLPVALARPVAGALAIGASVHDLAAARQAAAAGADWLTFGHVFATASHPDEPPRGLAALAAVTRAVDTPVIAIGGIDTPTIPAVLAAGAAGVAVISAILAAPEPGAAAARLRAALDQAR